MLIEAAYNSSSDHLLLLPTAGAPIAHDDEDGRLIAGTTVGSASSISKPPLVPVPVPVHVPSIDMSSSIARPSIHRLESPRHGSLKTVSFAPVNQTLQADNRIINSSPRLEILTHPPPPPHHPHHPSSLLNSNSNTMVVVPGALPSMISQSHDGEGDESMMMMVQRLQIHHRQIEEGTLNRLPTADSNDDNADSVRARGGTVGSTTTTTANITTSTAQNIINIGNDKGDASIVSPFEGTLSNPPPVMDSSATVVFRENLHLEMSSLANSACYIQRVGPNSDHGDENSATACNDSFAYSLVQSRLSISMTRNSLHSVMTHTSKGSVINQAKIEKANLDPYAQQDDDDDDDADDESGVDDLNELQQELIEKAVVVIRRVLDKLTGLDFKEALQKQQQQSLGIHAINSTSSSGVTGGIPSVNRSPPSPSSSSSSSSSSMTVEQQVDLLIREACSNENLSQSFFGWCPFW